MKRIVRGRRRRNTFAPASDVLARAVKWHLEHRIIVHGNKRLCFGEWVSRLSRLLENYFSK